MDRAEELSTEAEEELRDELDDALPDEVLVDVDAEVDADSHQFVVSLYDESTEDIVSDVVGDDVDIGVPHPQQFIIGDDVITGIASQRDWIQKIRGIIDELEGRFDEGAPIQQVVRHARRVGIDESKAEHEIEKLKQKGEVYEPRTDHLRTT